MVSAATGPVLSTPRVLPEEEQDGKPNAERVYWARVLQPGRACRAGGWMVMQKKGEMVG